jgi:hypothetical protein
MNSELADFSLLPVFLVSVAVILLAAELGRSHQPLIDTPAAIAQFAE